MAADLPPLVLDQPRLATLDSYGILDTPADDGFDEIVELAVLLCDTPVGLVSLVAQDRQWFKARVGFPSCETDLNSSVCAHALAEPDVLIIPDLTQDARTRCNPLVTGEPHIRFYAGAPLRTADGHSLGSLCVIDSRPRPDGLTPKQTDGLRALARQVVGQLDLRRLLRERETLVQNQQRTQDLLRAQSELLQTVTDHVGQAVFQLEVSGNVAFVNPAAEAMFGYSRDEMMGQSLHDLVHYAYPDGSPFPANACDLRQALKQGHILAASPQVFFRKDGTRRQVMVTSAPVVVGGVVRSAVLTVADVTESMAAATRLVESEAHWRGLFERLREVLIIGEVMRDTDGVVCDWRYLDVNPAWVDLTGRPAHETIGRTIREVFPEIEEAWVFEPGHVVATGESVSFTRQIGQLGRWYEGRVSAMGPETFVILFLDVTERLRAEQALASGAHRKVALARLGDCLRTSMDADAMGFTAGAIVGPVLGAVQAGYAAIDAIRETVQIGPTWCAPGTASIAGLHSFRDYGSYIDDLKAGRIVSIPDVAADARTRAQAETFATLGVTGLINVPVIEQGDLVAVFLVLFDDPRPVTTEELDFVQAAVDRARAGIARIRAEERQTLLNGEISHRLKNSMAMIQAIANQTLKRVADREPVLAFEQRLMALSTAHDILLRKDWETADLDEVLQRVLEAVGVTGRYDAAGPPVKLGPRAAMSTSLLLHELATNASKYGALRVAAGRIDVRWTLDEELVLDWRESGGPPAVAPARQGFGSRLLRMGLVGTGGSQVRYERTGLEATFRAPRNQVEQA